MVHHKYCVPSFLTRFGVALSHTTKLLTKCCLPDFCCGRVLHQLLVTVNCFASYWMHHWVCVVLQIGHYLLDMVLLECGGNEGCSDLYLLLDCEGVYRLMRDKSMPGSCW